MMITAAYQMTASDMKFLTGFYIKRLFVRQCTKSVLAIFWFL